MFEVGRICIKLAGRDAGEKCVVVEKLKDHLVLIDGLTRRRKCNINHLEPLAEKIAIKSKASHADIVSAFSKLGITIKDKKKKEKKPKPTRKRKEKSKEMPKDEKKDSKKETAAKPKPVENKTEKAKEVKPPAKAAK